MQLNSTKYWPVCKLSKVICSLFRSEDDMVSAILVGAHAFVCIRRHHHSKNMFFLKMNAYTDTHMCARFQFHWSILSQSPMWVIKSAIVSRRHRRRKHIFFLLHLWNGIFLLKYSIWTKWPCCVCACAHENVCSWILIESEIRNSGFNDRVAQMNWTHSLTQISFYLLTSCT